MRTRVVIALAWALVGAAVTLCLVRSAPEDGAWAGPGAAPGCTPGDTNGDGKLDVSDAVAVLTHLFRAGPPPAVCEITTPDPDTFFPRALGAATVVVVRHAEKEAVGDDPGLTPEGLARAQRLGALLQSAPVTHLIASDFLRTQETLAPLAATSGLAVEEIATAADVVTRLESLEPGTLAVVAHHSFTIHDILTGMGLGESVRSIGVGGENYDNFFMVFRVSGSGPQLVHLRY